MKCYLLHSIDLANLVCPELRPTDLVRGAWVLHSLAVAVRGFENYR